MVHPNILPPDQRRLAEMTPFVLRPACPQGLLGEFADPVSQPTQENSVGSAEVIELSRFQRAGEWLARQNNSGRMNLAMWGVSTWPGLAATYSQMILFGARALGTYVSVQQAGFTGVRAVVEAGRWTYHAFTCPVSSEQFPPELMQPSTPNTRNFETLPEATRSRNLRMLTALILRMKAGVG